MKPLTAHEMDILDRRFKGATIKEVAAALGIGRQAVANCQSGIYRKLGVDNLLAAFHVTGHMRTESGEQARIDRLRADARAQFQAIADSLAPR